MNNPGTIPTAPGALPLVGHTFSLLRDPCRFLSSLPPHGDLVAIKIGRATATVVCDPELTAHVLLDDRTFDKGGVLYDRAREAVGNSVITCPHSDHRRQRRLLQDAFRTNRMTGYLRPTVREIAATTGAWRDGQTIEPLTEMSLVSARVLLATLFETAEVPPAVQAEIVDDVAVVIAGIYRRMLTPRSLRELPTPWHRRYEQATNRLRQVVMEIIAKQRVNNTDHGDLLSIIMLPSGDEDAGSPGFSDAEINDQIMGFLAAGTETTANLLSWALQVLAHDSALQQRLHDEVDGVDLEALTFDDLPRLELTRAIVTETLRCYPPVWIQSRTVTTDTELGGHHLPRGTTLVCSPYLIHHRADLYPDPERFAPEKWLGASARPARGTLVPFGGGARKCLGDTFGFAEATVALAHIVANWRLQPLPGQTMPRPSPSGTLKPRKGHLIRVSRRHDTGHDGPPVT